MPCPFPQFATRQFCYYPYYFVLTVNLHYGQHMVRHTVDHCRNHWKAFCPQRKPIMQLKSPDILVTKTQMRARTNFHKSFDQYCWYHVAIVREHRVLKLLQFEKFYKKIFSHNFLRTTVRRLDECG